MVPSLGPGVYITTVYAYLFGQFGAILPLEESNGLWLPYRALTQRCGATKAIKKTLTLRLRVKYFC